MATIYELSDLRTLSKEKKALDNVVYQTEDKYFLGDSTGRLTEVTDLTLIDINNTSITNNETDITALEAEDARLEKAKADKCFTIAMSISL